MGRLHVYRGKGAFDRARYAKTDDQQVCGVILADGHAAYFTMPADASDVEVQEQAFAVRNGRPVNDTDRLLLRMSERLEARTG